jgi:uncharacterized protein (TIGR03086 family)
MDGLDAHEAAAADIEAKAAQLTAAQMDAPTPCEGWSVHDLLNHVVGGNKMTVMLLDGATKEDALAAMQADHLGDDPLASLVRGNADACAALRKADLSAVVDHPAMQMPGSQLLNFRTGDLILHSWDLARAIGADETLAEGPVAYVWEALQPMAPMIGQVGVFGTGPSGDVPDTAPLQQRLLDLTGRRP